MKNNKALKLLALTVVAVLVLSNLFAITSFADNGTATEWLVSESEEKITNETEGIVYEYFYGSLPIRPDAEYAYVYDQAVMYLDINYSSIVINPNNPDAIWIEYMDGYHIFVTKEYRADLEAFTEGKGGNYFITTDDGRRAKIDREVIKKLDENYANGVDTISVGARFLKTSKVCDVIVQDETKTFAYTCGSIFSMNNALWYVSYESLDSSYFDANGNLSYYHGKDIIMTRVERSCLIEIEEAIDERQPYEVVYKWEIVISDNEDGGLLGDQFNIDFEDIFWVIYFAFIVIPAIALVVVGCVLPFIKKLGKPKYWFIVSGFAALWAIAAIVHWVLLAFPQLWQ